MPVYAYKGVPTHRVPRQQRQRGAHECGGNQKHREGRCHIEQSVAEAARGRGLELPPEERHQQGGGGVEPQRHRQGGERDAQLE